MVCLFIIFVTSSATKPELAHNGAIRHRRGSSRGGQRRRSNSNSIYNNMPISPMPGTTLFAPHSSICLSERAATVVEDSLSKLADSSSDSEESIPEHEEELGSTIITDKNKSTGTSKKSAIKAVRAIPVSNDHVEGTNGSDNGGTPVKVIHL